MHKSADNELYLLISLQLLAIPNYFLLNIAEHEKSSARRLKTPVIVGIFIFISWENFMLS